MRVSDTRPTNRKFAMVAAAIFMAVSLSACDKRETAKTQSTEQPGSPSHDHDEPAMAPQEGTNHQHMDHEEMEAADPLPGASIYHLPGTWQTSRGDALELSHFRGKPVVMAIIYTSCEEVCPLIVEHVKRVESKLPPEQRDDVQFVLVSMDPERDTVAALKAYAEKRKLDRSRWSLLRGPDSQVRGLAATVGVRYKQRPDGDFSHSNTITLLDEKGQIVAQRKRLDEPLEPLVDELRERL